MSSSPGGKESHRAFGTWCGKKQSKEGSPYKRVCTAQLNGGVAAHMQPTLCAGGVCGGCQVGGKQKLLSSRTCMRQKTARVKEALNSCSRGRCSGWARQAGWDPPSLAKYSP